MAKQSQKKKWRMLKLSALAFWGQFSFLIHHSAFFISFTALARR
jgi:hypothetical protein